MSRSTVYDTNNKKYVRASLVGAPDNIHPLTVGAGSACPEHTHKNKNENHIRLTEIRDYNKSVIALVGISSLENANIFLPKSFNDAPI